MGLNRQAWDPIARDEYEDLLGCVAASSTNTSHRLDLFERLIADAAQAHRYWAREVERACTRHGYAKEIKAYQDRNRAMVATETGELLNLPSVQGRVARTDAGEVYHQRALIEVWPWEQILEKRSQAIRSRRVYTDKIAHYDKLLALRELVPDSLTPVDAARRLGITVNDYLAGVERAA